MNKDRFYVRGRSFLGITNTILGALFNRVIVRHVEHGVTIRYSIRKATDFPAV